MNEPTPHYLTHEYRHWNEAWRRWRRAARGVRAGVEHNERRQQFLDEAHRCWLEMERIRTAARLSKRP